MIGFEFLRPGLFWLLLLAPLAFLAGWAARARSRAELARWVAARHELRFLPGWSRTRGYLRVALGAAGLLFLALAALGPVRGFTYRAVSRKGLDLVVCLDTSRSMLAQDLRPSRLERGKREIVGLMDRLAGDRVALVAFSGDARDITPLTRDKQTLEGLLKFVTTEDNHEGGTDLAAAIEHALSLFDGRTGAHEAIVLLTDGEDLAGKAAAQAAEAVKRNIRVFVVGLGTEAGGKIPVVDEDGNASFLRDPEGNEVVSKLERESLLTLARSTGGEFLTAEQSPTPLEDLYRARISRIEGREIEGGERRVPYDRFQWPLALGVLCLLLELGLRATKRVKREYDAPRLAAALLPLALLGGEQAFSYARSLKNAVQHHELHEPEAAEQAARAILEHADALGLSEVQRAKAHYALGVITATRVREEAKDVEGQREAARDAFSSARALAGPGELRLNATYDLGALELDHAEAVRATIPEVSGQPAAPPPAPAPGAVPLPPSEPADPLQAARELYGAAKTWFVERLRMDWHDEDTRADLELIQRRLQQLDEIEKQREQQKQQQQDPNQQNQDQKDQKQDPKDQKDKQDKDQKGQDPQDPEQQDPKEGDEPEDQQQPQPGDEKPDEQKQEPQPGEESEQKEGEPQDAQQPKPGEAQPQERVLTREEVMQLLDKLGELEKQQKALEAMKRAKSRAKTKRDW